MTLISLWSIVILIMEDVKKNATENLVKLAMGMEVIDEICEIKYVINEQGEEIAVEKKVRTTKRFIPPSISAILELLDKRQIAEDPSTKQREIPYDKLSKNTLKELIAVMEKEE